MTTLPNALVIAGLTIAVFHLFRWPWGELHRVVAYAVGTSVIWGGVYLYLGPSPLFWQLSLFPVVVGSTTLVLKFTGQAQRWAILTGLPWLKSRLLDWLKGDDERS